MRKLSFTLALAAFAALPVAAHHANPKPQAPWSLPPAAPPKPTTTTAPAAPDTARAPQPNAN